MSQASPPSSERPGRLPLLAVRDVVLFPQMSVPLSVGRPKSVRALELSGLNGLVAVCTQRKASEEDPRPEGLHAVGVIAEVAQSVKTPDGTLKVILRGVARARLKSVSAEEGCWAAELDYPEEPAGPKDKVSAAAARCALLVEDYARSMRRDPPAALNARAAEGDPGVYADLLAAHAVFKLEDRQALLETFPVLDRLERLAQVLEGEIEIVHLERKIHTRVKTQIQKTQKEYYLTEQMKAIQKELRQKDDFAKELDELRAKIAQARMPKAALESSLKELARLEKMMPFSPESTVCRTYLDWMISLPWSKKTRDILDLERARTILEKEHYGLEKIKERVLEYLAVCRLTRKLRGPILCFVGPPGVGKTSMGRSIAHALNRSFARISLGGVRDEAEIRGHRRTYIGSMPGRVIQSLRKAKSRNPVFLLDEIDKMGMDWRGDPAAALLEVLDPEQNASFVDHYLDTEFDLSSVLFICTANTLESIPVSLQDRLEILRFSGYTQPEKLAIAQSHLLPRQIAEHGLKAPQLGIPRSVLERVLQEYTREAGVRGLEREIAALCRKAAREVVEKGSARVEIKPEELSRYLGVPKYTPDDKPVNALGVATGLAWTEVGGQLLAIEALSHPGKGDIQLTGKLGTVMQESAKAALSYVRSIAADLGIPSGTFLSKAFHVHVPEGAIPKDGPSAGIAIAAALASRASGRGVRRGLAMTGEITLSGRVLPIGGLKEKVLAAHRAGIETVLFPEGNRKDLADIPKDVQSQIELKAVSSVREALELALGGPKPARGPSWKPLRPPVKGGGRYDAPQRPV